MSKKQILPHDNVNHPEHYTTGGIETIDYLRAKLTKEQFYGMCLGTVLKYSSRAGKKMDAVEDLRKAQVYLGWAIEALEDVGEGP